MKLYLNCGQCGTKVYLESNARTRLALSQQWGHNFNIQCPHCRQNMRCSVKHVFAESETNNTTPGAIIGGLVGLLGGPLGVLIGGVVGGALGNETGASERQMVEQFNNS